MAGIIFSPLGALQLGMNVAALRDRGPDNAGLLRLMNVRGGLPKMEIHNLTTGEWRKVQFNPAELEETLSVDWQQHKVVGLSHQPMQYIATDNATFQFDLIFDALEETQQGRQSRVRGTDYVEESRRFMSHLCYSAAYRYGLQGGAPPRVLFYWPRFISMTCVVQKLSFRYARFAATGQPVTAVARVTLMEIRDVRLTSEEVREKGTLRESTPAVEV